MDDAIHESMFQAAGAPITLSQLDGDEKQDAFDKNGLASGPNMPDSLLGIALTAPIVSLAAAAWLDGPEIDPVHNGRIVVPIGEGAKGRKIVRAIDDERVGSYEGHG